MTLIPNLPQAQTPLNPGDLTIVMQNGVLCQVAQAAFAYNPVITDAVVAVGENIDSVNTVAADITNINIDAANIASINTCAVNIGVIEGAPGYAASAASSEALAATYAAAAEAAALTLIDHSTTLQTIGLGNQTFTVSTGKQFQAGQLITIASTANVQHYEFGQIISYAGTTLVVDILFCIGTGLSLNSWNISLSGLQGAPGGAGLNWRGNWAVGTTYEIDDGVAIGGSSYVCIQAHFSDTSVTEPNAGSLWPAYWGVLAAAGQAGAGALLSQNNLSDVASVAASQQSLGFQILTTAQYEALSPPNPNTYYFISDAPAPLISTNNLSDLTNDATARTNLGLGAVAQLSTINLTGGVTGSLSGNNIATTTVTNANLTGPITSVGNATVVNSQTGTGSTFVMNTSPTLVTPNLGTPASGTLTNCTGLPVAGGGTGLASLTANNVILGNGSSSPTFVAPGTTNNVLTSNGTTWVSQALPADTFAAITSGTNTTATMTVGTGSSLTTSGSGTITATAVPASGLTGTTLASGVTSSSLTSFGAGIALGTPASGTMTNVTGTAANLTAGHVTTNANLTGPITSTGNATAIAAQTGTGTTFVMQTSPSLITPALGTPSSGNLSNCTAATTGALGVVKPDGTTITIASGVISAAASPAAFNAITSGTNTTATMTVGTGGALNASGSGTITATAMPASGLTGSSLPSGITSSSLTSFGSSIAIGTPASGTLTNCSGLPLTGLASQGANTFLANATGSAAAPTAIALSASTLAGMGSTGNIAPITLGTGLTMTADVLSASGGSSELVLLATATASTSSSLTFTSLISSSYWQYLLVFKDLLTSTTASVGLKLSSNNGSTYAQVMSSQKASFTLGGSTTPTLTGVNGTTPALLCTSGASSAYTGWVNFTAGANTSDFVWESFLWGLANNTLDRVNLAQVDNTTTNALQIIPSAGNFTSGVVYLYGVKNT